MDEPGTSVASVSGVFVGQYVHSLDPKKRLTIPSSWREQMGESNALYVLPAVDQPCLCVFPARVLAQRLERIRSHSLADAKARQFARVLGSRSELVAWDSQGRIRINDALLGFAGLSEQVVLAGAFESFELWRPESWRVTAVGQDELREAARYVGF